jgi:hypothetical protein
MKRILPAMCALLLMSCIRAGSLTPTEVMEHAAQVNQNLDAAAFTANIDFHGQTEKLSGNWNGNAVLSGIIANQGKQLQFTASIFATSTATDGQNTQYELGADLIIPAEKEVYMKLNKAVITPPSPLFPEETLATLLNQWWLIGSSTGAVAQTDIAPDPALLRMQLQTIAVTKDNGLVDVDGHSSYLYDITIDPVKMRGYIDQLYRSQGKTPPAQEVAMSEMNAKGRLWIDEKEFYIRRIVWDISSKDQSKPLQVTMDIALSKQNEPAVISIPPDAHPFPSTSR